MNTITVSEALFVLCVFAGIGLCAIGVAIAGWIVAKTEELRK